MNLAEIFQFQSVHTKLSLADTQVAHLTDDSRLVKSGSLFFAREGVSHRGFEYIPQALEKGAIAIVAQSSFEEYQDKLIVVDSIEDSLENCLKDFYQSPLDKLNKYAVTGTNGKTTTAYILDQILSLQAPNLLLGTIENKIASQVLPSKLTTPGICEFYQYLDLALQSQCQSITMELSSHAIEQSRIGHIKLDAAIFTNLSQDHLDYHGDMKSYFNAKKRMFTECLSENCIPIINIDDSWGRELVNFIDNQTWTYSLTNSEADLFVLEDRSNNQGIHLNIQTPRGDFEINSPLIGEFNKENILGAVGALLSMDVSVEQIQKGLSKLSVPGRLQQFTTGEYQVFVDYAHTPDALSRVLETLAQIKRNKIITVFGCGGDRDAAKRPLMARAAEQYSDLVFLTSDNPRTEDPYQILNDVQRGFINPDKVFIEVDRRSAIAQAIANMNEGDIVLVAGKGHEDYQIIGHEKKHFDDREVVQELLKGL